MTNNFQVYFLFLNTKLNLEPNQDIFYLLYTYWDLLSAATIPGSVGLVGGGGHGRKTSLGSTVMRLGLGVVKLRTGSHACTSSLHLPGSRGGWVGLQRRPRWQLWSPGP